MISGIGVSAVGIFGLSAIYCTSSPIESTRVNPVGIAAEGTGLAMAQNKRISRGGETKARGIMTKDAFGMKGEEYFTSPFKNVNDMGDRLVEEGFEGLVIGGPDYYPLGKGDRLPIVALRVAESMESSRHLFNEYALITAMDLSSNELYAGDFVERKSVLRERDLEKDPPPPGKTTDAGATNLFTSLGLPKIIGEYLVTVILLDKTSNRIQVRIGPPELEPEKDGFQEALLKSRRRIGRKGRSVIAESVQFVQGPDSPAIPEASGIVLKAITQRTADGIQGIVTLCGSYNIPNPYTESPPPKAFREDEKIAVVPLSLLATGTRVPTALVLELHLPIPEAEQVVKAKTLAGFFTVQLNQSNGLEGDQTYFFRAFSGSLVSNPAKAALSSK